jgi:hypothetical protein
VRVLLRTLGVLLGLSASAAADVVDLGRDATGRAQIVRRARMSYPREAKERGVVGTVVLRVLVGVDGRPMPRKDECCRPFASASRKERRERWHRTKCMYSTAGPLALVTGTLEGWAEAEWTTFLLDDGTPAPFWLTVRSVYKPR